MATGSEGVWTRGVEVIMSGTPGAMVVDRSSEETSVPGWVIHRVMVSGLSVETSRVVGGTKLELVTSDGINFVLPGEPARVDMAELGCSPIWVTEETVECDSEGIRVGEVTRSGTLAEIVVVRTPEVSSLSA